MINKILSFSTLKICIIIFVIALIPRFGWFFVKGKNLDITIPAGGDAIGYDQLAVNLIKYHQYAFTPGKSTAYREPVYPYFLAIIYSIFGLSNYTAVRVVQIFISSLTCVIIFLLAKDLFGKKVALLSSFISCFWPHFVYYSTTILRETLFCFLLILCVYFLNKVYQQKEFKSVNSIIAGIMCGLCCLMNSTALLFVFLSFVVLSLVKKFRQVLVIFVLFVSLYSLWVIRNYIVFNEFVLGSTVGGMTIYGASVGDYRIFGTPQEKEFWEKDEVMKKATTMDELQANKYFMQEAKKVILSNPKEFFIRCIKRFLKLYRIYPHRGKGYVHSETLMILVSIFSYGILLPFFVYSFFINLSSFKKYIFLYLPILIFSFVYTLIWAVIRYRLPLEPYIIIFASYILGNIIF
jgi:4-amino-4-deoxy-L-arabinose transferase-like glycosyltransferase